PGNLRRATEQADRDTMAAGQAAYDPARRQPVDFKLGPGSVPFEFLGVEYKQELSAVSGGLWTQYDPARPVTFTVPFYDDVQVTREVCPPVGYVVPAAWTVILERLRAHGLAFTTLTRPLTCEVETYKLSGAEWQGRPFENHHLLKEVKATPMRRTETFPAGSAVVYLDQPGARVAVHLLEPDAPDSLLRWGYLDAVFEPKEYAEERVMEAMAREMMARDPELIREFEKKIESEPAFAASARQRLEWFYERTPYFDDRLNVYPVGRLLERVNVP
ncbi:MAG: peptidase M14, partial [Gluconacetobacter diazotrophicus]|nr:peptidase M14 [Gluconacetobacter diazotrophicus]